MSILISLFLSPTLAWSGDRNPIDHSVEVEKAQRWLNSQNITYPILIFDRDAISFELARRKLNGPAKKSARVQFYQEYVISKIGLPFDNIYADQIDMYLYGATNVAAALPLYKDRLGKNKPSQCFVFANTPPGNSRLATHRLLKMDQEELYPIDAYDRLSTRMSAKELYLFSLYHEIGHCVDPRYAPYSAFHQNDSYAVHLSEAFAEIFAYLYLVKRLGIEIGTSMASYRGLFSRVVGPYLSKNGNAFAPHIKAGGAIYYLTPYLIGAHDGLVSGDINVEFEDLNQLILSSMKVVEDFKIKSRSFTALIAAMDFGFNDTLSKYKEMALHDPEFFSETHQSLVAYDAITTIIEQNAFNGNSIMKQETTSPQSFPFEELCQSLEKSNWTSYSNILNSYRNNLVSQNHDWETLEKRNQKLMHIADELDRKCR